HPTCRRGHPHRHLFPPARGHPHLPGDAALRCLAHRHSSDWNARCAVAARIGRAGATLAGVAAHGHRNPCNGRPDRPRSLGVLPRRLTGHTGCVLHRRPCACPGRSAFPLASLVMSPTSLWTFLLPGYLLTIAIETPVLLVGLSRRHSWGRRLFAG